MNNKELIFAGRICGIDRLSGKKPSEFARTYKKLFQKYMDVDILCGILDHEESYKAESALLDRARELSLSESDRTQKQTKYKNLTSVFSRLSIKDGEVCEKNYYELKPFSLNSAFPSKEPSIQNLHTLCNSFYRQMEILSKNAPVSYEDFLVVLDRIFMDHLWCITSSDYEGEDISLYDHLKVTQAILSCLTVTDGRENDNYILLMGDFSGIQKYIFSIASTNQSHVAKRLRARSFYVDIMIRVFAQYVAEQFSVSRANILLQTGGKFYLLLPDTDDSENRLDGLRQELDRFLYDEFHGKVSLNLAWEKISDSGLKNYSESVENLNKKLKDNEKNAFSTVIKMQGRWDEQSFIVFHDLAGKKICPGCQTDMIDANQELCPQCSSQIEMGRKLANARYIVYERKSSSGNMHIFKDFYIRLTDKKQFASAYYAEVLSEQELSDSDMRYPVARKFMVNHVSRNQKNEIHTFSQIAEQAGGMNKLGVLKADVDVLGYLFADGFRKGSRHYGTVSRVNTMSRMLEVFFSGYVNDILEQEPAFKNVYSVFSGGDDLFLIGPWDVMPRLALHIRNHFQQFTASNPCVTMSASIAVFHDKEHIAYMADISEEQLEYAKDGDDLPLTPPIPGSSGAGWVEKENGQDDLPHGTPILGRAGRNCVCYLGDLFTWEDFAVQLKNLDKLVKLVSDRKVTTGILRRLAEYSLMYRQFLIDHDVFGLMYDSLLSYDRKRNYKTSKDDDIRWFYRYVNEMQMNTANYNKKKKNLYYAVTMVKSALNMTRKGRQNG